ncbi:lysis protein [Halopseudomonas aestusnigri]|uniref:lysis system i-spanin subunit Rz n=1 Tax=Halopseudomonas aestusnigri TaxID=857252 RepID=UPI001E539884|nr:lysis system i-spanin subunit Rz [Halopseudomonas aestusnigri]UGV30972.1 lysis protein [Halopseudomonas aestusnigri]
MLSKYKLLAQIGGALSAVAALVLLGFGVGWSWQGANGEAALERANTAHANTLGEIARAGQRQLQKQQELLVAERERLQALDQKHYGELEHAKADNERLRRMYAGADAERRELRIAVRVARADAVVSETTGGSSLGNVAALELSPEAGSSVWDIRAGMIDDQAKLRYFQQLERERQGAD